MNIKPEKYNLTAHGKPSIFLFDVETGVIHKLVQKQNLILYSGADVLGNLLAGNSQYKINTMYLEFKNGTGITPIAAPAYTRTGGLSYYTGLASADILRVPIDILPLIEASGGNYESNKVTFFAQSEGSVGEVNSLTFSSGADSAVYGAALVAAPDVDDMSQDIVFSRIYFTKITKQTGMEIGVTWPIQFN